MYDLTDFESYKTYFEGLANAHTLIDGFMFGDQEVQNNEVRAWRGKKLWLWPYGIVRIEDALSDNYLKRKEGSLFVGGVAPSAKYDDENAWVQACEQICESIVS